MKTLFASAFIFLLVALGLAQEQPKSAWRSATEKELQTLLPARAPVEKERIETEMRTASGITDGKGAFIAGVVLITAGYSAEGKYSHFMVAQAPIEIGEIKLAPGEYVFGYRRSGEVLEVSFYEAASGKELGKTAARLQNRKGRIQSFRISPPAERSVIELGRFEMPYKLSRGPSR
jgi:hypothetical protein